MLFAVTLAVVVPLFKAMSAGALPAGPVRLLLFVSLGGGVVLGAMTYRRHVVQRAGTRRTTELLRFFDDISMLRPRAQAARALLAAAPTNEAERKALVAVSQFLGELARSVHEGTPEGRSAVLAHPIVGAWLRALAVTPVPLSFPPAERAALQALFPQVGAAKSRSEQLDDGSRALLERDAVMFRTEEAEARIF